MFKMIDDFFLSLEGKKNNKPKAEKIKIDSLGSILYHLYVSGKLDNAGLDGLDGWKDDKEKFKTDLLNDIKTFLFGKWEKPWNPGLMFDNDGEMVNGFRNINGRVYKKQSNVIGLQQNKGKSPFFATLKHIAKNGGTITDKTKVTSIISYVPIYKDGSKGEKPDFMLPKFHSVVNVDYVEGIKKPVYKLEVFKDLELNEYVENFINILHSLSRIPNLVYDQSDRCYYAHHKIWNKNDSIHLVPIRNFKGINEYYSTLFHEITHSTMNPLRFGRGKTKGETTALEYANEELVAEMGAMIICSELGLQYNRQNSITYLKSWLAATKDKDTALIEAYAYACDAAEYLMKNINFDMLLPKSMRDRVAQKTEPTPDKTTKRTKKTGKAKEKAKKQTGRVKKIKSFKNIIPRTTDDELNYELARMAHLGTSFYPEKRAKEHQRSYASSLNSFAAELESIITTEEQAQTAILKFKEYKEKFNKLYCEWLRVKSNCLSSMITGSSNFPVKKAEKANAAEQRKLTELVEFEKKAQKKLISLVENGLPDDVKNDKEWKLFEKEVLSSLTTIVAISQGKYYGNKNLFVAGLKSKIETRYRNKRFDFVNQSLNLVKEVQDKYNITVFAPNNSIWKLHNNTPAEEPQKKNETLYNSKDCEVINNYDEERVQIFFPGKPSEEIRTYLKSKAFKWSNRNSAWQRKNTRDGISAAVNFAVKFFGEPEPDKPQKKSKLTNKAVEKGKKSKKVKKQSPVTPPSEPGKPLNIGKQQVKGSTTSAKSQFYFIEDSHNLAQLDEAWIESVEFKQLNKEMCKLAPRYMMAVDGVPMNYLKKHKLYFDDATGNINLAPIPTKVSKAKDLFKLAGLFVAKDVLRPAVCGVYMDAKNGCMVATDAHLLIKIPHNIEGENRILNQYNQVIDELYPAYDAVIPRNCKHESYIDLQALLNEVASMVELKKLTSDKVLFFSIATPIGNVSFNAFNLYKLINGLMAAGCITATFKTNGKQYAAVFEDVATGLLGLIMPLNLIDDRFRKTILLTQDSKVTDYSSQSLSGTTEPEQPALFGTDKKDGKVSLSGIDNDPIFTLNYQFNQNFQLFKKGKLKNPYLTVANEKKGAITTTLVEHGINGTVIIRPSTLAKKTKKHDLTNENIIDLPMKFNYPLMISSYYNHQRGEGINVFVQDVTGEGLLMAGVKRDANKQMIVYEILTIHGKSDNQLVNYAKNATYINTKKIKELFSDPSINGERFKKFLDYIDANIIQNFENSKSIDGTTETKTPLKDFGLSKLGSQKKGETYKLSGDLGDFLGEYDRLHYSIVLRGEKGAGKSRLLFQLINAFASENLKAAFLSLEMHPGSSVMTRYAEEYITPDNLDRIDVTDTALNYNELNQLCKMYDVVAIDSWTKLKAMEQNDFDRLQKDNPGTIIIAIFQSTTGKVTRGGNMPEYDAGTVIQVNKGGLAECEKNRYTATDKIYSVFDKCLVEIEEEEK